MTDAQDLKWVPYLDKRMKWRWRAIAANGRIVGASSQGYEHAQDALANARLFGGFEGCWNAAEFIAIANEHRHD